MVSPQDLVVSNGLAIDAGLAGLKPLLKAPEKLSLGLDEPGQSLAVLPKQIGTSEERAGILRALGIKTACFSMTQEQNETLYIRTASIMPLFFYIVYIPSIKSKWFISYGGGCHHVECHRETLLLVGMEACADGHPPAAHEQPQALTASLARTTICFRVMTKHRASPTAHSSAAGHIS